MPKSTQALPARCPRCRRPLRDGECPGCAISLALGGEARPDSLGVSSSAGRLRFNELWAGPPVEFSHYRIEQHADGTLVEIGHGGMGVAYAAYDKHLRMRVVLKFISPELLRKPGVEERFLREARVAARLIHPHIAMVRQLEKLDSRWYYAMEFVPGEDLDQLVYREGPLDPEDALALARQVTLALAEAERHQLVHRDIKPSNLMIERRPDGLHCKIIDFGLAKLLNPTEADPNLTEAGVVGTPHYASPEQLREHEVDQRSDFYSLGATLWFALTGSTVFHGSYSEVSAAHLTKAPEFAHLPRLPGNLAAFLESCLQRDREQRAPDCERLLAILDDPHLAQARWRRPRLRRLRLRLAAGAALAALAVAAGLFIDWKANFGGGTISEADRALRDEAPILALARGYYRRYTTADNEYAIALLQHGLRYHTNSGPLRARLAMSYCQRTMRFGYGAKWVGRAEELTEETQQLETNSSEIYEARAMVYYARGNFRAAEREFRLAAKLAPNDADISRGLGVVLREQGQLRPALAALLRSTEQQPEDSQSWSIRGNLEKKLGDYAAAERSYREAVRLSPPTSEPRLGVVHTLYLQRRFEEAERELTLAVKVIGDVADAECLRAQLRIQRGDLEGAEKALRASVQAKPEGNPRYFGQIRFRSLLGWVLAQRGASEEAARHLDAALELDRRDCEQQARNGDFWASLAATHAARGERAEALVALRQAIDSGWADFASAALDPRWRGSEKLLEKLKVDG